MTDLGHRLRGAARHIDPGWTAERAERVGRSLQKRRRRRAGVRVIGVVGSAVLVATVAGVALRGLRRAAAPAAPMLAAPAHSTAVDRVLRFGDGSTATPLGDASDLRLVAEKSMRAVVVIVSGGARLSIHHDVSRPFRVEAGEVSVEDLGTLFTVERLGARVKVQVEEGSVRVAWSGGSADLLAGQSDLFPRAIPAARPVEARDRPVRAPTKHSPGWREFAREGRFDRAYDRLVLDGAQAIKDEPAELLLAADVARWSHHPAAAITPLRRLLSAFADDARAPAAAFTLGRVLLDELDRPAEAAVAFAEARAREPAGALAEDALAREVEALARSGDLARAGERAREYAARYPTGLRLPQVRRLGQTE
jgi:transmembrane sensor